MFDWALNAPLLIANFNPTTQPAITCWKIIKETLEQGVKYIQSEQ